MTAATIELAGGPVSWGVDFADAPDNPPYTEVLAGIRAAGLRWTELGPPGYLPADASNVLAARGLGSVGTFVFERLHEPTAHDTALVAADRALAAAGEAGGSVLVVIDRPGDVRAGTAGRSAAAERLDGTGWRALVRVTRAIASRAGERGVRAVFHPHAGSYVEFADEIDRLLDSVPPDELGLCVDTGHALFAGEDPAATLGRYGDRVGHVHLKDVDAAVRERVVAERIGFWSAIALGIFCPVGDGMLDLDGLRRALGAAGYAGFATIEQDRRPGSPGSAEHDLRVSAQRLRAAGIG